MLLAHNAYRAKYNAPILYEDYTLDNMAQNWTNYLIQIQRIDYNRQGYGQNVYVSLSNEPLTIALCHSKKYEIKE